MKLELELELEWKKWSRARKLERKERYLNLGLLPGLSQQKSGEEAESTSRSPRNHPRFCAASEQAPYSMPSLAFSENHSQTKVGHNSELSLPISRILSPVYRIPLRDTSSAARWHGVEFPDVHVD